MDSSVIQLSAVGWFPPGGGLGGAAGTFDPIPLTTGTHVVLLSVQSPVVFPLSLASFPSWVQL